MENDFEMITTGTSTVTTWVNFNNILEIKLGQNAYASSKILKLPDLKKTILLIFVKIDK